VLSRGATKGAREQTRLLGPSPGRAAGMSRVADAQDGTAPRMNDRSAAGLGRRRGPARGHAGDVPSLNLRAKDHWACLTIGPISEPFRQSPARWNALSTPLMLVERGKQARLKHDRPHRSMTTVSFNSLTRPLSVRELTPPRTRMTARSLQILPIAIPGARGTRGAAASAPAIAAQRGAT
jgi:hypothetical protein